MESLNSQDYINAKTYRVQFAKLVLDILRTDYRYANCLSEVKIPGFEDYKKVDKGSSLTSDVVGGLIGLKWYSISEAHLKLQGCIVKEIQVNEADTSATIWCRFPLFSDNYPKKYLCGGAKIIPIYTGLVQKKIIGVKIKKEGDLPGLAGITNDQRLLNEILNMRNSWLLLEDTENEKTIIEIKAYGERRKNAEGEITATVVNRTVNDQHLIGKWGFGLVESTRRLLLLMFELAQYVSVALLPPPP